MNRGVPPTARNARTGELTPPGVTALARSNRATDAGAAASRSVISAMWAIVAYETSLLVAGLPGADADLIALTVGEHPERRRVGVGDQSAAGGERGLEPPLRLVVGHHDVEVDAVALNPWLVHLLEPDGRAFAVRVEQLRAVTHARPVPHDRSPERRDRRDVHGVDGELEHLHRPLAGLPGRGRQSPLGDRGGDLLGKVRVTSGDVADRER